MSHVFVRNVAGFSQHLAEKGALKFEVQKCVKCGCTDDHACEGGCYWVASDKCSKCFPELK